MKTAILQLERQTKGVQKQCDLGFDHVVPGDPETVWVVVDIEDGQDISWATSKAFEQYPPIQGWGLRFGTINARKLE